MEVEARPWKRGNRMRCHEWCVLASHAADINGCWSCCLQNKAMYTLSVMHRRRARNTGNRLEDVGWWDPNPGANERRGGFKLNGWIADASRLWYQLHLDNVGVRKGGTNNPLLSLWCCSWRWQHAHRPQVRPHQVRGVRGCPAPAKQLTAPSQCPDTDAELH